MLESAKLTGVVKEDYLIEVETLMGIKRYCKPVFNTGFIGVPYDLWVKKYQNKFLAIIGYEEDDLERPLLIGIRPLKNNQTPEEGLEDQMYMMSAKFRIRFDDDANEAVIDVLNGGTIKLGDKDVTEKAVLGDKLKTWEDNLCDQLTQLCTQIQAITVATAVGPSSVPINAPAFATIQAAITALKGQTSTLLSTTVKLK